MGARSAICRSYLPVGVAPPYLTREAMSFSVFDAYNAILASLAPGSPRAKLKEEGGEPGTF